MHRLPMGLLAGLLLVTGCGVADWVGVSLESSVPAGGSGSAEAMSEGERAWASHVLHLVNLERAARGLDPLAWHEAAAAAAYAHAFDMDVRSFVGHENPDGEGPGDRLRRYGVSWLAYGENIGKGQASPEDVVARWMGSEGHAANILSPSFTHVGIGVHTRESDGPWWVQDFIDGVR